MNHREKYDIGQKNKNLRSSFLNYKIYYATKKNKFCIKLNNKTGKRLISYNATFVSFLFPTLIFKIFIINVLSVHKYKSVCHTLSTTLYLSGILRPGVFSYLNKSVEVYRLHTNMHLRVLHELWAIWCIEENKKERGATLVIFDNLGRYISIFL